MSSDRKWFRETEVQLIGNSNEISLQKGSGMTPSNTTPYVMQL